MQKTTLKILRWAGALAACPRQILKPTIVNIILALTIITGVAKTATMPLSYDDIWLTGEWLINYQGGFVRRGLPGEIIYQISSALSAPPIEIVRWLSIAVYLGFAATTYCVARKHFTSPLILSGLAVSAPLLGGFIIRKDCLTIIAFSTCLAILLKDPQATSIRIRDWLIINAISSASILSHESFGFVGIGGLFLARGLLLDRPAKQGETPAEVALNASNLLYFSPAILSLCLVVLNNGTPAAATNVHGSWQGIAHLMEQSNTIGLPQPKGAIEALGWDTIQGLSVQLNLIREFSDGIIWTPAAWLLTIYTSTILIIGFRRPALNNERGTNTLPIALWQLLCTVPLFLAGWDYGRWIFIWSTSSILLISFAQKINPKTTSLSLTLPAAISKTFPALPLAKLKADFVFLAVGIPACCWSFSEYLRSTPLWSSLNIQS